jgi:protein-S-isoprenylcysteine O-methyltransferase Ste14
MMTLPPDPTHKKRAPGPLRGFIWLAIFAALLFLPAGTLAWPGAWVFLAVMAAASVWGLSWLGRHDPELLAERLRPPFQRDQPRSDKLLMGAFMPLWFGWYVLMAFDRRFGWSDVPVALQVLGAALICLGLWLSWTVLRENSYAAPVVKVQKERGHKVVSSGPYAYVRHPMYASVILFAAGVPLLLGSWWGLLVSPLLVLVLAARAVLEERTLTAELEGYADYVQRVRYRFVPLLW